MDFSNYQSTDLHMLYGLINTELRNHSQDLEDLCKTHDIDMVDLKEKLAVGGYEYQDDIKQFR